ncbi:DEAD/DEAH box helicase [Flavilitoribacter nigricans]|uniref:DNA helicase n=1 Tax=Flavilitoribacter nigricans (strain ATCC 23147 / DSM 23189 / NBRC 102662 / NCIMB 1420 / SS-2) TaxID=1122177 RepID=A0A2D0MYJ5_FLAN2|nr:ATP-dependent helicase [Flavilitoribacter nigricans]PHN01325.1 DNA helicase [Flavilitoribacter nigricans DSM 23189 = NBRC 102662]
MIRGMTNNALPQLFYRELEKALTGTAMEPAVRVEALYRLLNLLFVEATRKENLHFTTLFARIAYTCHKYQLEKRLQYYIHQFRKRAPQASPEDLEDLLSLGTKVMADTIQAIFAEEPPAAVQQLIPADWTFPFVAVEVKQYLPKLRVLALEEDRPNCQLLARSENQPEVVIPIAYNIADHNENFNPTIDLIRAVMGFPVLLNLIDVEIGADGVYRPRAFVVEPDFLVEVTAVSECFQVQGTDPWGYLLKKFLPFESTAPLMIGHIANFFLDELMTEPESTFQQLAPRTFQLNPLTFCLFSDRQIREILQKSQKHYLHLKRMVMQDFAEEGIHREDCYLEPSFYSETYGLQGRLDLLYRPVGEESKTAIVELKSGKPFMPNVYGLSASHFTQTLLYDLLVHSAFGRKTKVANYILYSGQDDRQLRFAPTIKAQQYEAMQLRNQLVALERLLSQLGQQEDKDLLDQGQRLFGRLSPVHFPNMRGFARRNLEQFEAVYRRLSELEKCYFISFAGFIAREQALAKTGASDQEGINGLAALWLNSPEEKLENFDLIEYLELEENRSGEEEPILIFQRTERTHRLANFRQGDIAVLYPRQEDQIGVLASQIFKCSIIDIDQKQVVIRLRSRQFNDRIFADFTYWNLEHDLLDSSFTGIYRSLFAFCGHAASKKQLLLTTRPPDQPQAVTLGPTPGMTPDQREILGKALSARDYFLLWGPPGTGKTSVMLRYMVDHLLHRTEENILLLAYTNRAVDEICESIERIGPELRDQYLRIGSRYSTAPAFRDQLLRSKTQKIKSRKALRELIDGHRIFVSTVSSIVGKPELLQLKSFQTVIIDEASQILEPMLVGLLPNFERFILIGDHKQLPAVVTQDTGSSAVRDEGLQQIGLNNLRNSLFERLFKRCKAEQWDWAYAQLRHQGRMHQHIMEFPNRHFYEKTLQILPEGIPVRERQLQTGFLHIPPDADGLLSRLGSRRMIFIPTPVDESTPLQKTNQHEAELVGKLVSLLGEVFASEGKELEKDRIGVITPYRAQIAQIRYALEARGLNPDLITIDTVERYQGGARDIILLSLCTNSSRQLELLSTLSDEGVDRKLNVALTRAREQIVVLGNRELLSRHEVYRKLLDYCEGESVPS